MKFKNVKLGEEYLLAGIKVKCLKKVGLDSSILVELTNPTLETFRKLGTPTYDADIAIRIGRTVWWLHKNTPGRFESQVTVKHDLKRIQK